MVLASGPFQGCSPLPRCRQMRLDLWAMERFLSASGSRGLFLGSFSAAAAVNCLQRTFHSSKRCPLVVPKTCALSLGQRCCTQRCEFQDFESSLLYAVASQFAARGSLSLLYLFSQHVPCVTSQVVDALSRFHWQELRQLVPDAELHSIPIPLDLLADLSVRFLEEAFYRNCCCVLCRLYLRTNGQTDDDWIYFSRS